MKHAVLLLCLLAGCISSCMPSFLKDVPELAFFPTQIDIPELRVEDSAALMTADAAGAEYRQFLAPSSSITVYRGTYLSADDAEAVFTADIVRTDSRLDAYALLTGLRPEAGSYIPECRGFADDGTGVSVHGKFFIRVTLSKKMLTSQSVIRSMLLFFNKSIPADEGDGAISIADIFTSPENPLPYYRTARDEFFDMESIFGGRIRIENKDVLVFYALFPSEMSATDRYTSVLGSKKGFVVFESSAMHSAWMKNPSRTYSFLMQKGRWVYGITDASSLDGGRSVLDAIGNRLAAAESGR